MNERVSAEVEIAKKSAEEHLEAVKKCFEDEIQSLKGVNLMAGEQGFRLS